jgi:hypothetical protein
VVGVVGVVGWDHGSGAGAGDQCPVVVGFEAVVVAAEPVEFGEGGVAGVGPRDAVVDFGVGPQLVAALTVGWVHSRASFWAADGPRPTWTTVATSRPG